MASPPPPGALPSPALSNPIDLLHTDSTPLHRRAFASVPSQSKPVYPSYHLERTTPLPHRPRPSDAFKPLNILRSSLCPPILRLPFHVTLPPAPVEKPVGVLERRRPMEEFIAVVFGNEVWMGLVDFKSDKPIVSRDEQLHEEFGIFPHSELGGADKIVGRDAKRNSAVLVPRTFRTPWSQPPPARTTSPIYEENEAYEHRKVEFDISRNIGREPLPTRQTSNNSPVPMPGYRNTSPPSMEWWNHRRENTRESSKREGIYVRREPRRESKRDLERERSMERERSRERDIREKRDKGRERQSDGMPKKQGFNGMEVIIARKDVGKESTVEIPPPKEIRKGLPPPAALLHGYRQPGSQPKSILKKADGANQPVQVNGPAISCSGLILGDRSVVKPVRAPADRNKGELWGQSWNETLESPKTTLSNFDLLQSSATPPQPTTEHPSHYLSFQTETPPTSPMKSKLSPMSPPFIPRSDYLPSPLLSPSPRRITLPPHTAEQVLGRLTPDSSLSKSIYPTPHSPGLQSSPTPSLFSSSSPSSSSTIDDWSTKISSPLNFFPSQPLFPSEPTLFESNAIPTRLASLKVTLCTEIYSPHPAGPPPSSPSQAYSRIALIDTLSSPVLHNHTLIWRVPHDETREFDNRLFYPVSLRLYPSSVEIDDSFQYLSGGRFWCGGFRVCYSSRRAVSGDVTRVKATLREELSWLEAVEVDVSVVEKWMRRGEMEGGVRGDGGVVGHWRDEVGRGVKRELRPEMFI